MGQESHEYGMPFPFLFLSSEVIGLISSGVGSCLKGLENILYTLSPTLLSSKQSEAVPWCVMQVRKGAQHTSLGGAGVAWGSVLLTLKVIARMIYCFIFLSL